MIKIEMEFASGAQAREEMLSLLAGMPMAFSGAVPTQTDAMSLQEQRALDPRNDAIVSDEKQESTADYLAPAEPTKRTRRTKAQIAADEEAARQAAIAAQHANLEGLVKDAEPAADAPDATEPAAEQAEDAGEDQGDDPNTPPSAVYAHRLGAYKEANPSNTELQFMKSELSKVNDKFGLDEVRKLMVGFGIPRIGEVPAERYPELMTVIDKRLVA